MRIEQLRIRHPDYDADGQEDYRQLYDGGETWEPGRFLPQREKEPPALYKSRLDAAVYTNDAQPLVDMLPSYLFSTPLAPEELPADPYWLGLVDDCDRAGTSLSAFFEARLQDALVTGASHVWATRPPRRAVDARTRGEQERAGDLAAYLVPFTGRDLIRWGSDASGRMAWALFETADVANELGAKPVEMYRWTYIDGTHVKTWTAPAGRESERDADPEMNVEHGAGRLPVVSMVLPRGMWAMRQIRDAAVRLLRARAAYDWNLDRTAYAMWALFFDGAMGDVAAGDGYWLKLPKDASAQIMEPGGASAESLRLRIDAAKNDLHRVMRSVLNASASDGAQAQSGESKKRDLQTFEIGLVGYDARVRPFVRDVLRMLATVRGDRPDVTLANLRIGGLDGWQRLDPEELLALIDGARDVMPMSPTFRRAQAKLKVERIVGGDHPDVQTMYDEIDTYTPADDVTFGRGPGLPRLPPADPVLPIDE